MLSEDIEIINVTINNYERMHEAPAAWNRIKTTLVELGSTHNSAMLKIALAVESLCDHLDDRCGGYCPNLADAKKHISVVIGQIQQ